MANIIFDVWEKKKNALGVVFNSEKTVEEACTDWRHEIIKAASNKTIDDLIQNIKGDSRLFITYEAISEISTVYETKPKIQLLGVGVTATLKDILRAGQEIQELISKDYSCLAVIPYHTAGAFSPGAIADVMETCIKSSQDTEKLDDKNLRLSELRQALAPYSVFAQLDHLQPEVLSAVSTAVFVFMSTSENPNEDVDLVKNIKSIIHQSLCTRPLNFAEATLQSFIQELYFVLGNDAKYRGNPESVGFITKITIENAQDLKINAYIDDKLFGSCEIPQEANYWLLGIASGVLQERGISIETL